MSCRFDIIYSKENPMKISFIASDSEEYYFLLKHDQSDITKELKTFEILDEINSIFKIKHFDQNYSMSLKRYLIVPIAPTIVLAEWLTNSDTFGNILEKESIKNLIDYSDYFVQELHGKDVIKSGTIKKYDEKFNLLYNYFYFNFLNPNDWYYSKKNYIISTAIWSMISFLIGLGDRHTGNIMFNKTDGNVIHIDFGYVALKGLNLPVKEIVYFRFTPNLRKALGIFGECGLFNFISIKSLMVFKEFYKALSSRIEFFQFDPMFDKTQDKMIFELYKRNELFFSNIDVGIISKYLKELIDEASNPDNLEKMYCWWEPFK